MQKAVAILAVTLCASTSITLSSCGQTAAPLSNAAQNKQRNDEAQPKPEQVLRRMADYLGNLPAFSCRVETKTHLQTPDAERRFSSNLSLRIERPDRVVLTIEEGDTRMTVLSDGKQLVQYSATSNRYVARDAPADLAAFAASGEDLGLSNMTNYLPTDSDDFYKTLTDGVRKSEYVGREKLGDVLCHRCRFIEERVSWDIWVEATDRPLVHKVVVDLSKLLAEDTPNNAPNAKLEHAVMFSDWNIAPKFTAADFAFEPPTDAQQVESLFQDEGGPHPLVGQAAPAFATVDPDGHPIDLQKHLGKNVILLDFWATWCGPCVIAMPEVAAVAKKFADRGLVFYAVNAAEDVETVKDFIKQTSFNGPVAMDFDGNISSNLYQTEFLPQTVLVGKDGKVQVVHLGFSDDLSRQLSADIEALLAGKDLASAALGESKDGGEQPNDAEP